jgi:uncharacterized protein
MKTLLMVLLVSLTGCFSLGRDEPLKQHYVLGESRLHETGATAARLAGLVIGLRQAHVADYLESPLIVVRQGPNEVRFAEFSRWGEELGGGVIRAVAVYLAARAPLDGIDIVPWPPRSQHDFLIQLHLLRFEGLAPEGPIATEGEAHLLARWEILNPGDGAVLARGTTDFRVPGWKVGDFAGLVTLLDQGLQELSGDLVAGVERLVAH